MFALVVSVAVIPVLAVLAAILEAGKIKKLFYSLPLETYFNKDIFLSIFIVSTTYEDLLWVS